MRAVVDDSPPGDSPPDPGRPIVVGRRRRTRCCAPRPTRWRRCYAACPTPACPSAARHGASPRPVSTSWPATRVYLGCAQGQRSPVRELGALPALNARVIIDYPTREATALAGHLDEAVAAFVDATAQARGDEQVSWHAGYILPLSMMTCVLIGEMLVHGHDIAVATGQPWTVRRPCALRHRRWSRCSRW